MTRLKDNARFWDVRFDVPSQYTVRQADGTDVTYDSRRHKHACVAAETIGEAIAMVLQEWPDAVIWQANNHGRECHVLIDERLKLRGETHARG